MMYSTLTELAIRQNKRLTRQGQEFALYLFGISKDGIVSKPRKDMASEFGVHPSRIRPLVDQLFMARFLVPSGHQYGSGVSPPLYISDDYLDMKV